MKATTRLPQNGLFGNITHHSMPLSVVTTCVSDSDRITRVARTRVSIKIDAHAATLIAVIGRQNTEKTTEAERSHISTEGANSRAMVHKYSAIMTKSMGPSFPP